MAGALIKAIPFVADVAQALWAPACTFASSPDIDTCKVCRHGYHSQALFFLPAVFGLDQNPPLYLFSSF
jgi:hypothetical protein